MITADNYKEYLKTFLIASAHKALEEGCEISDTIGIIRYAERPDFGVRPMRAANGGGERRVRVPEGDGRGAPSFGSAGMRPRFSNNTDYVTGIDLDRYLNYVASVTPLKTPPAFDQYGVLIDTPTPENSVFGNAEGTPANFTEFSLRRRLRDNEATLSEEMARRVFSRSFGKCMSVYGAWYGIGRRLAKSDTVRSYRIDTFLKDGLCHSGPCDRICFRGKSKALLQN